MLIAQQKRQQNIAEYLLYMWQVEDLIRACGCDIDTVQRQVIDRFDTDPDTRHQIREWYESLLKMMELENVKQSGHLQICKNVLIRLHDLHVQLLAHPDRFSDYHDAYYRALPHIVQLRASMPDDQRTDELETCFNALYGVLLLRLQGKPVSEGTNEAVQQISHFLGLLAAYFRADEQKPLFDETND